MAAPNDGPVCFVWNAPLSALLPFPLRDLRLDCCPMALVRFSHDALSLRSKTLIPSAKTL
jgi:hypothetical protein